MYITSIFSHSRALWQSAFWSSDGAHHISPLPSTVRPECLLQIRNIHSSRSRSGLDHGRNRPTSHSRLQHRRQTIGNCKVSRQQTAETTHSVLRAKHSRTVHNQRVAKGHLGVFIGLHQRRKVSDQSTTNTVNVTTVRYFFLCIIIYVIVLSKSYIMFCIYTSSFMCTLVTLENAITRSYYNHHFSLLLIFVLYSIVTHLSV